MPTSSDEAGANSQIRTELKEVTVLFADIVKSTRLIESMDPEQAGAVLDPVLMIMIEAVRRRGGSVVRIMGDGIMAIFGAPVSIEEHAFRACFAAMEITERVQSRDTGSGSEVAVRVGLDSGQVLVRTYQTDISLNYDAVGMVVHLANKVEEMAEANTVFLSRRTERQARGFISVEPVTTVRLARGEYEVLRLRGRSSIGRWTARQCRVLCDMFGRAHYVDKLRAACACVLGGAGRSVLLEGEAGMGKSRLLYEFIREASEEPLSLLRLEATRHSHRAMFQPFRELLSDQLEVASQEPLPVIDDKLRRLLVRYGLDGIDRQLALCSLFNSTISDPRWTKADPDWRREMTTDTIVALLAAMASRLPLVLIAEDIHWMDQGSVDVIERIVRKSRDQHILLIVTQRPGEAISIDREDFDHFVQVERLSREDALAMCNALLGPEPELDALKQELIDRTGGVPLFLEEIVLNLAEAEVIEGSIGHMKPGTGTLSVDSVRLPSSVTTILASRIDRLANPYHDLLQLASVIGVRFPAGLLKVAAGLDDDMFEQRIVGLLASRLIIALGEIPEEQMSFSHAAAQQVCYRSMVAEKRAQLHATVARAMETYYGGRIDEFTEELAHHYSEAGNYEAAIALWQEAAHRALLGAANVEAVDALKTALGLVELTPESDQAGNKRLELLSLLGSALIVAKGPGSPEVADVYSECRALAIELRESRELFRSLWGQWRIAWKVPNKMEIAHQLSELADQEGGDEMRLQAHHAQWAACYNGGALQRSLEHVESGLKLYRETRHSKQLLHYGGHDPAVCGYGEAALCLWILGDAPGARKMMQAGVELARRINHPGSIGHSLDYALFVLQHSGDANRTLRFAEEAIAFADEARLPHYAARARAWRSWAIARVGNATDGVEQMASAVDEQRETGIEEDFPVFLEVLAGLEARLGRYVSALGRCEEALELAAYSGMRHWLSEIHRRHGTILRRLGPDRLDAAVSAFDTAISIAREQQAHSIMQRIDASLASFPEGREALGDTSPSGALSPGRASGDSASTPAAQSLLRLVGD